MHHVRLDAWSRLASPLHRMDPRVKVLAAGAIVLSLALTHHAYEWMFAGYFLLLTALVVLARLPLTALMLRAGFVLPFAGAVAALNWFGGDPKLAAAVIGKSFLSAYTVLLLLATTPLHALFRGLESMGAPRFFLMVAQFLYRYLFVLSEQAQHMMHARRCRSPRTRGGLSFAAAAGMVAVLFGRSYARAERIYRAMLARGFRGHFVLLDPPVMRGPDFAALGVIAVVLTGLHVVLWNL